MKKWGFCCYFGHKGELQSLEESLNRLGEQGWELVAAVPEKDSGDSINVVCWLKRPVE